MTEKTLGQSGLSIEPFVLGGNVFGMTAGRDASFAILDRFAERGGGMIDTADVYSAWVPGHRGGESESMIGAWLKARGARDKILIATKVGMMPGGLKPRSHPRRGARLARPARDRHDRPLFRAQGRSRRAAGRDPRRVW